MTIEIDDAGTGDPLLGAVIGFYRRETEELHFEWIPIETYQEGTYHKDLPPEEAAKAVMRGLLALNIKADETVMICQGSIFDKAREALDQANITHEPLKVEGKLQDAVEEEYVKAIEALGIQSKALRVDESDKDRSYKKRYFVLLNWAKKKVDEREKYVKNGLNFWKFSKDQEKPIPGGWKKARKDFEDALEKVLKGRGSTRWNELAATLKHVLPRDGTWINQPVAIEPNSPHGKGNGPAGRIQLYSSTLGQMYVLLGKGFEEAPGDVAWKAIMWKEGGHAVNGLVFYLARDDTYKANTRWLQFLRPHVTKLLGSHIRYVVRPWP